ncbi:ABC transporter substrate-binding protein [Ammoniphilus sp. YIM 78166]|uniref:ABC transporter substrate-binding protein n=1 Tax=Ammoniphilus sp. YIM 78166 TaxID=1644106 RepID=UPI00106F26DA|nr:extracellular solute-binding protein [Ammoniphilus sp. YIM 78166]
MRKLVLTCLLFLAACSIRSIHEGEETPRYKEKVRLEFFSPKVETAGIFNQLIRDFEREHPDIYVEQTIMPNGMDVLKRRIARGQAPDIFITYPLEHDYVIRAEKGYLLDLTEEDFIQAITPVVQDRYLVHSRMYGVALTQNAVGVLYNRDIFESLHLKIPESWAELVYTMVTIRQTGITPILMSNKDAETISVFNLNFIANEFSSDYWDEVNQGQAKISDDPRWQEMAENMLSVVSLAQEDSFEADTDQVNQRFAHGEGAMYVTGTWMLSIIEKWNPQLNYGIFPFPSTNDPQKNYVLGGVDIGLAISSDTPHPEAAKEFLKFLVKQKNAQKLSDYEGSISVVQGVNVKKEVVKPLAKKVLEGKSVNWPNHYWIGGTRAERDYRRISQQFFMDKNIEAYLRQLDQMFAYYREE